MAREYTVWVSSFSYLYIELCGSGIHRVILYILFIYPQNCAAWEEIVWSSTFSFFLSTELCDAGKKVLDGKYSKRKNKPNCERCENGTYMSDKNLEKECLKCPEWHEATGATDDHGATKCECKCMKYCPSYINSFFVLWTFPSLSVGWVFFKRGVWFKFSFLLAHLSRRLTGKLIG